MLYASGGPSWVLCDAGAPGAVSVVEDTLPDAGTYRVTQSNLLDMDGVPHLQYSFVSWSRAEAVEKRAQELQAVAQAQTDAGFPYLFGTVQERLQLRGPDDKVNWLIFKDACQDGLDAGIGDQLNPQPVRCASNRLYSVTHAVGKSMAMQMRSWGGAIMKRGWELADAITLVASTASDANLEDALAAVDINSGWPGES